MLRYSQPSVDESDVAAVVGVLRSSWLTTGPAVESLENAICEYTGCKFAVAMNSATSGLYAAAVAAELDEESSVGTTPLTFIASANAIRFARARPVLLDVDNRTWNLDLQHVSADLDGLVGVHYAGLPIDFAALKSRPKVVIEDASHALGAKTPDGPVGNCAYSDMTVFSLHAVKPITAGEGGVVTTNSEVFAERLRRFRSHGVVRRSDVDPWVYDVVDFGFNMRLTDIQAALAESQLQRLDSFTRTRNEIANVYQQKLRLLDVGLPPSAPEGFLHSRHLFPIRVQERRRVFQELSNCGIGVQVHYVPVHHLLDPQEYDTRGMDLCNANALYEELISLPLHPELEPSDVEYVIERLAACL